MCIPGGRCACPTSYRLGATFATKLRCWSARVRLCRLLARSTSTVSGRSTTTEGEKTITTCSILARDLQKDMVLALPFGKTATVEMVTARGHLYISVKTEHGTS